MAEIFHKGEIDMSDVAEKAAALAGAAAATATGVSTATVLATGAAIAVIGYGIYELGKWVGRKIGRSEARKEFDEQLAKLRQSYDDAIKKLEKARDDANNEAKVAIKDNAELIMACRIVSWNYKWLEEKYKALKAKGETDSSVDQLVSSIGQGCHRLETYIHAESA